MFVLIKEGIIGRVQRIRTEGAAGGTRQLGSWTCKKRSVHYLKRGPETTGRKKAEIGKIPGKKIEGVDPVLDFF